MILRSPLFSFPISTAAALARFLHDPAVRFRMRSGAPSSIYQRAPFVIKNSEGEKCRAFYGCRVCSFEPLEAPGPPIFSLLFVGLLILAASGFTLNVAASMDPAEHRHALLPSLPATTTLLVLLKVAQLGVA